MGAPRYVIFGIKQGKCALDGYRTITREELLVHLNEAELGELLLQ